MNDEVKKPKNPRAFPLPAQDIGIGASHGMTLRDYFAGQALLGLLNNMKIQNFMIKDKFKPEHSQGWHAQAAYQFADAMLSEREE